MSTFLYRVVVAILLSPSVEDMDSQAAKSLLLMADASPKGKLDVWSPILFCGRAAACMPLQRMSDLLASTASAETKLQEAQKAADSFAELTNAAQAVGQRKKLPKAISTIRQKKLAAREQLQSLLHTLNMLDLELTLPEHQLRAADAANGEIRISSAEGHFLWNANTGHAVWDKILEDDLKDVRVVLSPDEGSSMFCTSCRTISSAFCDAMQQLPASLLMWKVLRLQTRRSDSKQDLLRFFVDAALASVSEMTSYRLYLKACPAVTAALLCEEAFDQVQDVTSVKRQILNELRREWEVVLEMEASTELKPLLKKHCPHTEWQCYREVMLAVEEAQYTTTPACLEVLRAWFPSFTQSANVEEQFGYMQDALKRAGKSQKGSMTTLSSVAVKALNQKVLQEGQAQPVTLSAKDWEGPMTRGQDVPVDKILSEFVSTSAHNHNRSTLNYMRGFIVAKRQDVALADAADSFWVASVMQRSTLFSVGGKFFLCIGSTPGIVNALPLRELEMVFEGPKPAQTVDEENVPCKAPLWETTELLQAGQSVKALSLRHGSPLVEELLLDFCQDRIGESTNSQFFASLPSPAVQVQCYDWSLHVVDARMASKLGSAVLFRRCEAAKPLLVWLMSSHGIVKVLSEALSRILSSYGVRLRQNASKSQKIRALMKLPVVQEGCSAASLDALDKLLTAMDDKRRKKASKMEEDEEEDEPEASFLPLSLKQSKAGEMMNEADEAWQGAKMLLEMLNEEDYP
eukprot:s684_g7.t1